MAARAGRPSLPEGEKREMVSFRLAPGLKERFKAAARYDKRSMAKALELAMEEYCKKVERRMRAEQGECKAA